MDEISPIVLGLICFGCLDHGTDLECAKKLDPDIFIVYVITIILVTQLRYIIDVVSSGVILFQSIITIHNGVKIFFELVCEFHGQAIS